MEWFDVAYRVYLVALFGGGLVLWLSSIVSDEPLTSDTIADIERLAPAFGGLVLALALAGGLRSGARGGPVAVEEAEARHVLLAPVDRGSALRAPALQRIRTLAGGAAIVGAIAAQLLGRRIDGTVWRWVWSGALAGATVGATYAAAALIAHALRVRPWAATAIGVAAIAVQAASVLGAVPTGPFDPLGHLAIAPLGFDTLDLLLPALAAVAVAVALAVVGRLSVEQLVRRSALVAQLRFAVTLQDLRTVTLLRRQLSLEHVRPRPWFAPPRHGPATWRRGVASIARFPARRFGRMALIAAGGAAAGVLVHRGTTPAILLVGVAAFLLGLETLEPLAQELDHPERTDLLPVDVGRLHQRLCVAPALALVALGAFGGAVAAAFEPSGAAAALAIGPLAALAGGAGAALNTTAGAPDPITEQTSQAMLPPEVAGMGVAFRMVWPPLVATSGALPILFVRATVDAPGDTSAADVAGAVIRGAIGVAIVCGAVWTWVERRQAFRAWWRRIQDESRGRTAR